MCRKRRFILPTCIAGALLVSIAFSFPKQPASFCLEKVRSSFGASSKWKIDPPPQGEMESIKGILSQKYNYLGSGAQVYAFLSEDGKYVLKFFKMKHLIPKKWFRYLPIPGFSDYKFRKIDRRILRKEALFSSYKMAYEGLKEETGLIYIHLNKSSDLKTKVRLYDKFRTAIIANLDDYEFVLQKKAQLVRDRLTYLLQRRDHEGALRAMEALLTQVVEKCKKGYSDDDSGIGHNYGFIGDQVIHFDVGRIKQDELAKDPSHYQREILRVGKKLEVLTEEMDETLLPELQKLIDRLLE